MTDKYTRKQGDRVWFDITGDGKCAGFGTIVGCASEPQAGIGRIWIVQVEDPSPIKKETYPFSCITAFDAQIKEQKP